MVRNLANKALIRISDGEFSTEVLNNLSKKLDIRDDPPPPIGGVF